jgi:hypothetical protein
MRLAEIADETPVYLRFGDAYMRVEPRDIKLDADDDIYIDCNKFVNAITEVGQGPQTQTKWRVKQKTKEMAQSLAEIYAKQFASFLAIGNGRNDQEDSVTCQFFYPDMSKDRMFSPTALTPKKDTNE